MHNVLRIVDATELFSSKLVICQVPFILITLLSNVAEKKEKENNKQMKQIESKEQVGGFKPNSSSIFKWSKHPSYKKEVVRRGKKARLNYMLLTRHK